MMTMTMMAIIKKMVSGQSLVVSAGTRHGDVEDCEDRSPQPNLKSQSGLSLIGVLAVMTLFAIGLLAVAPTVHQGIQRDKEIEAIRRGEEVAEAIKQYVIFYRGTKLPNSMDELLEGLPYGTKKRQILRPSAAVDPLSEDGKWALIKFDSKSFINFGRRVQSYNNGVLPASDPAQFFSKYSLPLVNVVNTETDEDVSGADDDAEEVMTDSTPFIGVASQSRSSSIIAYYGIENHSKWVFTPLFRGVGNSAGAGGGGGNSNRRNIP
jgi:type II secretory pathway pseudopilin PulG